MEHCLRKETRERWCKVAHGNRAEGDRFPVAVGVHPIPRRGNDVAVPKDLVQVPRETEAWAHDISQFAACFQRGPFEMCVRRDVRDEYPGPTQSQKLPEPHAPINVGRRRQLHSEGKREYRHVLINLILGVPTLEMGICENHINTAVERKSG